MLDSNSCEDCHYVLFLNFAAGPQHHRHHYSLVGSHVHTFLPGEAEHATDDPAVLLSPVLITDLSPLASVFHL